MITPNSIIAIPPQKRIGLLSRFCQFETFSRSELSLAKARIITRYMMEIFLMIISPVGVVVVLLKKILIRLAKIILYIGSPILALASVRHAVVGMAPLTILTDSTIYQDFFQAALTLPWIMGILCSPLYSYVVIFNVTRNDLIGIKRKLVEMSLKGGILASFLGFEAILAVIPIPFVFLSAFSSIMVFREYNQTPDCADTGTIFNIKKTLIGYCCSVILVFLVITIMKILKS